MYVFLLLQIVDVKWTVIKRDYLKGSSKKDVILSWVRFLSKLGVKTGIAVQRVNVNIIEVSIKLKLHMHARFVLQTQIIAKGNLCHTYSVDQRCRLNFNSDKVRAFPTHCALTHSRTATLTHSHSND